MEENLEEVLIMMLLINMIQFIPILRASYRPPFFRLEGIYTPSEYKERGKAAFGSMVSHTDNISHYSMYGKLLIPFEILFFLLIAEKLNHIKR